MSDRRRQWNEVIEKHHSAMVDDLAAAVDSEVRDAVARTVSEQQTEFQRRLTAGARSERRAQSENLNQFLRRLRGLHSEAEILRLMGESCAGFSERSVVLVFGNHQARVVYAGAANAADLTDSLKVDIDQAPAIVSAIESCDPVVAVASAEQLSGPLASALAPPTGADSARAYLFPVAVRHTVVAMLIAEGQVDGLSIDGPSIDAPSLELVASAVALRLESISAPGASLKPDRGDTAPSASEEVRRPSTWEALSPDDQRLHLQAQRVARVSVAVIRLENPEAVQRGTDRRNLYGALQKEIDNARREFLQTFLSKSTTMVDYLHLEILRTLAHDDDHLIGSDYPGPMV